ncbi:MAG: MFS transporter [Chloroflexi bacterium]|nr:MFS transporter [Chloroflexota bacterium]
MHETPSAGPSAAPAAYHELPRRQLFLTVAGLMLGLLLSALDQTIVGTAMPRIIAELHGFDHYAWVTTAYLLTSTTAVPIVGKLSDLYGRKLFLVGGAAFFVLTSALCGLSQDMTQLIVFRGLQGIGGGVLTAMVFTVISAIFPPAQRGRIQGIFSAIFGFASIVGPLLGGYLTDHLSWRWVFYVNLPVGAAALTVLWTSFPDIRPAQTRRPIDYFGAAALIACVVPLLLALSSGGATYPWSSPEIIGLFALSAIMLVAFIFVERRAEEPIIPLSLFKNQIVSVATISLALMALGMFGTILFIPLFIQGVIGTSATESGTVMMPMMMTMIVASIVGGQIISRTGRYKLVGLFGLAVTAFGMFLLSRMGPDTTYTTVVLYMMVVGLGLGPTMPVFTLAAQNAVDFSQLGVATSLTQFSRSIGGTLGAAVFGTLLTNSFGPALHAALPAQVVSAIPAQQLASLQNPQVLLNPELSQALQNSLGGQVYQALFGAIRIALADSLGTMFLTGAAIMVVGVVLVIFLKEIPLKRSYGTKAGPDGLTERITRQVGQDAVPSMPPQASSSSTLATPADKRERDRVLWARR